MKKVNTFNGSNKVNQSLPIYRKWIDKVVKRTDGRHHLFLFLKRVFAVGSNHLKKII